MKELLVKEYCGIELEPLEISEHIKYEQSILNLLMNHKELSGNYEKQISLLDYRLELFNKLDSILSEINSIDRDHNIDEVHKSVELSNYAKTSTDEIKKALQNMNIR